MVDDATSRWDETRRAQLTGGITFIFALSSASLGFCVSLLVSPTVILGGWRSVFFVLACVFLSLALFASVVATFTRLQDARTTAAVVRHRRDSAATQVQLLRRRAKQLGRCTWASLYVQLFSFLLGAASLLIALCLIFRDKLFP